MMINKVSTLLTSQHRMFKKKDYEGMVKTLFPNATNNEIKKYTRQISTVDESDPVLVITPNSTCGLINYNQ
ncbi:unnamed protein product [Rhizophagus irregularis]|nr:unnamed protein product [Rhizophagus irregularis]